MPKVGPDNKVPPPGNVEPASSLKEPQSDSKFGKTVNRVEAEASMPDSSTGPSDTPIPISERDTSTVTETEPSQQKVPVVRSGDVFLHCRSTVWSYYNTRLGLTRPRWLGEHGRYHVAYARAHKKLSPGMIDEELKKKNKGLENKHEDFKNYCKWLKDNAAADEYQFIKSRLNLEKKDDGYHLNPVKVSSPSQIIRLISNISCCLALLGREEEALNYINAGHHYFEGDIVPELQDAEYDLTRKL